MPRVDIDTTVRRIMTCTEVMIGSEIVLTIQIENQILVMSFRQKALGATFADKKRD